MIADYKKSDALSTARRELRRRPKREDYKCRCSGVNGVWWLASTRMGASEGARVEGRAHGDQRAAAGGWIGCVGWAQNVEERLSFDL
jgi:hypothetical protein